MALRVLATGQSNAVGRDTGGDFTIPSTVTAWNNENNRTDLLNVGSAFVTPLQTENPFTSNYNNMMIHAAKHIAAETGEDVELLLVAADSQGMDQWVDVEGTPGQMYARMEAVCTAASVTSVDYFILMQGEFDDNNATHTTWRTRFNLLLDQMVADSLIAPNTPVAVVETAVQFERINPIITTVASTGSRICKAYASDLSTTDNTHYTADSLVTIGQRIADAFKLQIGVI